MDENADASQAIFEPPPENWRRPPGRPRTTWMKNIHDDLSSQALGIHEARHLVQNRPLCTDWCLCTALRTRSGACCCWMADNDWLHGFPGLFTDTSEHIHFCFLVFCFYTLPLLFPCGRLSWLMSAFERTFKNSIPYCTSACKHTHTRQFNGPLSGTTRVGRYQKGKTNLDFTEAWDSEWQWHQLGHMQVCTSLQTDNHASTPPLSFLRPDALPAAQPTASKHWRFGTDIHTAGGTSA